VCAGGRLAWAAISDKIGRKNTFILFTAGSLPLYLALPTMVESVLSSGSTLPLYAFCLSTAMTVSVMGGSYAILPAYEADLFGTRFAGAVHGRMLLFSSAAALAGPPLFIYLRSLAEKKAVTELLTKVRTLSYHCTLSPTPSNLYSVFFCNRSRPRPSTQPSAHPSRAPWTCSPRRPSPSASCC
jgi:MFS family permease